MRRVVHLAAKLFKSMMHVNVAHIPYKGAELALADMLTGQCQMMFATALSVRPHLKSGRLRPLAVTTVKRSPSLPELPNGATVMRRIAKGTAPCEIGVGQLSEIMNQINKGMAIALAGTLPDEIQNFTTYFATMAAGSPAAESARTDSPPHRPGKPVFAATGID